MTSIRLHPEFGVNPTIPICFWCQKEKHEVAMLGAAYKGQAPKNMLLDFEPCDSCAEQMAKGITIIEANRYGNEPKYTGRWAVINPDYLSEVFQPESLVEEVRKVRKALMEVEAFERMFGHLRCTSEVPS
jgi:hypothetical protein